MKDAGQLPGVGPSVCPFVALAGDRDRRADGPDERNRCYAERAPRQRDLVFQSEHCYSTQFASCSIFLAWAARNAAEPAYVTDVASKAWGSGIALPEDEHDGSPTAPGGSASVAGPGLGLAMSHGEGSPGAAGSTGLVRSRGPLRSTGMGAAGSETEQLDWVSASAWTEAPWDERAEAEAEELELLAVHELAPEPEPDPTEEPRDEDMSAPKVPAALPMRRRRGELRPIRSRGSGEWHYADPLGHEPLVRRRHGVAPALLLGVLGLLVVSLVVFLLPSLVPDGDDGRVAAVSPSADSSPRPVTTRPAGLATPPPSVKPSPSVPPRPETYRVRAGDTLYAIAARFDIRLQHLQCINGLVGRNPIIGIDQRLLIPPEGYSCAPGWRNATPVPEATPEA